MMDQIQKIKCPICLDNATEIPMATEDFDYFECQRCGKFYLSGSLVSEFSHKEVPLSLISS